MGKITKLNIKYDESLMPDYIYPPLNDKRLKNLRFVLSKNVKELRKYSGNFDENIFTTILMNPSRADLNVSDRTVSKVIKVSKDLGYKGYLIFNLYPLRATKNIHLGKLNKSILDENLKIIEDYIKKFKIKKIFTLYGNTNNNECLGVAKEKTIELLNKYKVKTYCFGINISNDPKHPLYIKLSRECIKEIKLDY